MFTVELVNDNLYEWHVRLLMPAIAEFNSLYYDLLELKETTGREGILLNVIFNANYPNDPPFVRVVEPIIHGKQGQ